jgi:DNA-binding FadR family transcriptional regulator
MILASSGTGAGLPTELELSASLGVSRTAIREAVKALVAKGLIQVRPRIGTRVRPRHQWNHLDPDVLRWTAQCDQPRLLRELHELRVAVEPMAARIAARRGDSGVITDLWRHFIAMDDAVGRDDLEGFVLADAQFHHCVLGAGGNELFRALSYAIEGVLQDAFSQIATTIDDVRASIDLHRAAVLAISERAPDAAEAAMREVIMATIHRVGFDDPPRPVQAD